MFTVNVFILVGFAVLNIATSEKVVTCYYGSWATYRQDLSKFDVENIKPELCTHLIYTFAGITQQGEVVSLDPVLDLPDNGGKDNLRKFTNLKQNNPKLKTLLAVGGWNEYSAKYSVMAASPQLRQAFISTAINMISKFNFDGLDIDWEYPNRRDSVHGEADINNFSVLLKETKQEFDKHGYLLTSAVSSVRSAASLSYDIPTISQYLDFIHIMTYDLYGPWDPVTGHNAGLHKGEGDEDVDRKNLNTVDVAVEYWLEQGAPPEKIVLGVPFYGKTFKLRNAAEHAVRSPANGVGIHEGTIGYNEFCKMLQTDPWTVQRDVKAKVPYAYLDINWVSYDDPESIKSKAEYAMQNNLAGIMVWSIDTDDFHNVCAGGDYTLLRTINEVLNLNTTEGPTIPSTSDTTKNSETPRNIVSFNTNTAASNSSVATKVSVVCEAEGYIADPTDCSDFYKCVKNESGYTEKKFKCPDSLIWDQKLGECNFPKLAECNVYQ